MPSHLPVPATGGIEAERGGRLAAWGLGEAEVGVQPGVKSRAVWGPGGGFRKAAEVAGGQGQGRGRLDTVLGDGRPVGLAALASVRGRCWSSAESCHRGRGARGGWSVSSLRPPPPATPSSGQRDVTRSEEPRLGLLPLPPLAWLVPRDEGQPATPAASTAQGSPEVPHVGRLRGPRGLTSVQSGH